MKSQLTQLILLLFLCLSCSSKMMSWSNDILSSRGEIKDVTIITDALVLRSSANGNIYPSIQNSLLSAQNCNDAITSLLCSKNYTVIESYFKFSGTFLPIDTLRKNILDSLISCGAAIAPYSVDSSFIKSKDSFNAYLWMSRRIYEEFIKNEGKISKNFLIENKNRLEKLIALRDAFHSRYLFLTFFLGKHYSAEQIKTQQEGAMAITATTALFSLLSPIGIIVIPRTVYATFQCYGTFIDLESFEILWAGSASGSAGMLHSSTLMKQLANQYLLKDFPYSTININNKR
jgi:hypothetical protein